MLNECMHSEAGTIVFGIIQVLCCTRAASDRSGLHTSEALQAEIEFMSFDFLVSSFLITLANLLLIQDNSSARVDGLAHHRYTDFCLGTNDLTALPRLSVNNQQLQCQDVRL